MINRGLHTKISKMAMPIDSDTLSLIGQLGSMLLAVLVGRFVCKSLSSIWVVSFLGAIGAMCAHIVVDGQGACMLIIFAPVLYVLASVGRRDLAK